MLHPVDNFAIELFLNCDVRHRRGGRRPVPMLFARCEPHHIPWPDFLNRAALTLSPATAKCDNECLAQRMRMPGGAGTRFKRDTCPRDQGRIRRLEYGDARLRQRADQKGK